MCVLSVPILMQIVKPVRFSHHARNKIRWEAIDESVVVEALRGAGWDYPTRAGRRNRWKRIGSRRFLRVTYLEERLQISVISVVVKPRLPRRRARS